MSQTTVKFFSTEVYPTRLPLICHDSIPNVILNCFWCTILLSTFFCLLALRMSVDVVYYLYNDKHKMNLRAQHWIFSSILKPVLVQCCSSSSSNAVGAEIDLFASSITYLGLYPCWMLQKEALPLWFLVTRTNWYLPFMFHVVLNLVREQINDNKTNCKMQDTCQQQLFHSSKSQTTSFSLLVHTDGRYYWPGKYDPSFPLQKLYIICKGGEKICINLCMMFVTSNIHHWVESVQCTPSPSHTYVVHTHTNCINQTPTGFIVCHCSDTKNQEDHRDYLNKLFTFLSSKAFHCCQLQLLIDPPHKANVFCFSHLFPLQNMS